MRRFPGSGSVDHEPETEILGVMNAAARSRQRAAGMVATVTGKPAAVIVFAVWRGKVAGARRDRRLRPPPLVNLAVLD
jgi:hypothetical protein